VYGWDNLVSVATIGEAELLCECRELAFAYCFLAERCTGKALFWLREPCSVLPFIREVR